MRAEIAVLSLLFAASTPLAGTAQTTALQAGGEIRIRMMSGKPLVDGVYLNGQGPYQFLLDTGSQSNEVEAGLARKVGLTAAADLELRTPSGVSRVHAGRAKKVALGSMEAVDEEFLLTDMNGLHRQCADVRGVLGQEFLRRFDYTVDLAHHRLVQGAAPAGEKVAVRLIAGRMGVPTSEGELILDSGAELLFLFRTSAHGATVQMGGAGGASTGVTVEAAPRLAIGGRTYRPERAGFVAVANAEEAGLLPLTLFKAVFISNSGGYVILDPR